MRWGLLPAALGAACLAEAAEPPPKASDVLKPERAREIPSPINDRFAVRASYFSVSAATQIRLDSDDGLMGTELSAENDFGMQDSDDQARIELIFRLGERNRLRFDHFNLTRKGNETLTRDVIFGDEALLANDTVSSLLSWRTHNLTYLYSVIRNQQLELGVGFGLHILDGEAEARVTARQISEKETAVAPFPTLAADATWHFARRFTLSARANYLSADVDESHGLVHAYQADVQYRWRRNLAVGLGYTSVKTHLDIVDADMPGRFNFDVDGPELFFRASF